MKHTSSSEWFLPEARVREAIALVNEQTGNKTQADSFYRRAKKLHSELLKRSTKDFDEFSSIGAEISSCLDGVTNSINRLQLNPALNRVKAIRRITPLLDEGKTLR